MSELTIIRSCTCDMQDTAALPQNLATEGIADAIALGAREGGGDGSAVLMIVQPGERNSYDQQARAARRCTCEHAQAKRKQMVQLILSSQLCESPACATGCERPPRQSLHV